jgi:hypothetical protein
MDACLFSTVDQVPVGLVLFHAGACLIHVIHLSLIELNFAPDRLKAAGRPEPAAWCAEIGP